MPVHKNSDGTYQWGNHGKKYQRKSDAIKQMKAAFANGYKESFTFESSQYNTVDEAEKAYDDYLTGHISNVSKALDVLLELNIDFINSNEDKLRKIVSKHDASKYGKSEYEPYRKHFYPINEDEKLETEAFDKACSHHIKVNKHHWQYWLDDDGNLGIPDKDEYLLYTVERLCDWLAMSGQREQVPNDWYNANREDVVMPDYAFKLCDEVMSKVPEDYSSKMWKVTRGKLDESFDYKSLKPKIEDTDNDRAGVDMYKEKIKNGEHRKVLINSDNEILDGNHTITAYQELGIKPKYIYRGERPDFYKAAVETNGDAEKAIDIMIKNGTAKLVEDVQYTKESSLEGNSISVIAYHATSSEPFDSFDFTKHVTGMTHGDGAYFTTKMSEIDSLSKGVINVKYVLKAKVTLKHPYNFKNEDLSDKYEEIVKLDDIHRDYEKETSYIKEKILRGGTVAFYYLDDLSERLNLNVSDLMKKLGYDGIIDGDYIVAYSNDQIEMIEWKKYSTNESVGPSVKYLKKHFKNIKFNSNFSSAEIINESINSDITGRILNDILLQFQMRAVQSPFKKTEFTILSKNDKKVGKAYFTYPYDISIYVFGNKTKLNVPNNFDENDTQYDNLIDSYRNEFSKLLNANRKTSPKSNDNKVQLSLDLDESDIPDDKQSFKDFVIKGLEPSSKYIKSYKLAKENSHGQWGVFIYCYPSLDKQTGIFYDGYSTYISYDENNNYDFIFELTNDEITSMYDNDRTRVFYESYNIMNEQIDSGGYIFDNKIPRYDITPPTGYRFMYHNTSPDNLDSIDKNGLIVGNRYADNSESGIWCDDNNPSSVGYGGCTITFLVTEDEANKARVNNTQYLFYKDIPRKDIVFIDRVLYSPIKCKVSNLNEFIEQYGESKTVSVLSKWVPKVELDSIIKLLKNEHLIENFKVLRSKKGYLVEANMNQLKRKTLAEDPTRAKKSKHVQSKYIGISKYGVLNFMTTSETHSGVQWYQEIQFPSFQGFMNIVESGDTVDAVDVKKAMSSDNIKISCFTEDTLIKTSSGMKKIKDVQVGDKVLTHTGKYQEVLQTFENDYSGDMIEINGVKSTPNHPYLVLLPDGTTDWKMACEITTDMQLLEPEVSE